MGTPHRRRPLHHRDPTAEHPSQRGRQSRCDRRRRRTTALAGAAVVRQTTILDLDVTPQSSRSEPSCLPCPSLRSGRDPTMELLNDLRSNWTIIVAKIVLLVLLALCWYNVASFTQSTSQAVAQGLSADADVDLYTVIDDLDPDAFEAIRRDQHAVDDVASFVDRIDDEPRFDFISSYDQPVTVQDFRGDDRFDIGYGSEYTLKGKYQDESGRTVQDIKSIQLNETAYEFAGLSVQDGVPIDWDAVDWGSGRIPVLLGNEYRGVYELGARFTGAVILQEQELEVVGFLEPDSAVYFRGEANHYLDDTVIVPYPPTLAGLDRAALDRLDPELFGRLVFQVLNADLAVDHSLDFGTSSRVSTRSETTPASGRTRCSEFRPTSCSSPSSASSSRTTWCSSPRCSSSSPRAWASSRPSSTGSCITVERRWRGCTISSGGARMPRTDCSAPAA